MTGCSASKETIPWGLESWWYASTSRTEMVLPVAIAFPDFANLILTGAAGGYPQPGIGMNGDS